MRVLFLSLILITSPALAAEKENNFGADYHPATSELERTVEEILTRADKHFDITNKFDNTGINLTANLVDAITQENNTEIKNNCSGLEGLGTQCGLKYNPITCSEFLPVVNYYRTDKVSDEAAIVFTSEDKAGAKPNRYKLIYIDHEWRIDSISCFDKAGFNDY